jgi:hypothetical protein
MAIIRRQLADQLLLHPGLRGEVEVIDSVGRWQRREPQQPGVAACLRGGDLDAQQPLQHRHRRQVLIPGGVKDSGQRIGRGGHPQLGQVRPQPLVLLRLCPAHRLQHLNGIGGRGCPQVAAHR